MIFFFFEAWRLSSPDLKEQRTFISSQDEYVLWVKKTWCLIKHINHATTEGSPSVDNRQRTLYASFIWSINKIIFYHISLWQAPMTGMLGSLQLKWYSNTEKGPTLLYQYCIVDCWARPVPMHHKQVHFCRFLQTWRKILIFLIQHLISLDLDFNSH